MGRFQSTKPININSLQPQRAARQKLYAWFKTQFVNYCALLRTKAFLFFLLVISAFCNGFLFLLICLSPSSGRLSLLPTLVHFCRICFFTWRRVGAVLPDSSCLEVGVWPLPFAETSSNWWGTLHCPQPALLPPTPASDRALWSLSLRGSWEPHPKWRSVVAVISTVLPFAKKLWLPLDVSCAALGFFFTAN